MLGSALGGARSLLPALQAAQAPHLVFAVQHLEEVTVVGLQLLRPVGPTIGYGYHLQGRGKTILLGLALEVRWSVKVTGEQHGACSSHCFAIIQGDFVGWGLGDLKGLFSLGPSSVHEMYENIGKSTGSLWEPST